MISAGAQAAGLIKDKFFRARLQSFLPVRRTILQFSGQPLMRRGAPNGA
jgi:hypothetical protein